MARLDKPLFSDEAWGKIGQGLHYVRRQGAGYIRKHFCRTEPPRERQLEVRSVFEGFKNEWQAMSATEKMAYREYPSLHLTRYNVFMKLRLSEYYGVKYPSVFGQAVFGQSVFGL